MKKPKPTVIENKIKNYINKMRKITCYLNTIRLTAGKFMQTGEVTPYISGHEYVEQEPYDKGKKRYFPAKCRRCGDVSEVWMRIFE